MSTDGEIEPRGIKDISKPWEGGEELEECIDKGHTPSSEDPRKVAKDTLRLTHRAPLVGSSGGLELGRGILAGDQELG